MNSNKSFIVYFGLVLSIVGTNYIYAKDLKTDCVDCMAAKSKEVENKLPDKLAMNTLLTSTEKPIQIAKSNITNAPVIVLKGVTRSPAGGSSKESYQKGFCTQFEVAEDTVDIETLIEDMNASPYASTFNEFWTTPLCHAPLKNDTNVPILFNTASDPQKNEEFPSALHDYLVDEKKDPATWLKAINTPTSDGYTFLDYMQYNIARGFYSVKKDKDAALRVATYLCLNGGQYSKFKDSAKCP